MADLPRDRETDGTLALMADPYGYISQRCRRNGRDGFRTRLMGRPVTCVSGREAAAMFYQPDSFTRVGAMPQVTLRLLQDVGSVQSLDGEAHRRRKALFLAMMAPEAVTDMGDRFEAAFRERAAGWADGRRVVLLEEVRPALGRAVSDWVGLRLSDDAVARRTRELVAMVEGAGSVGWKAVRGLVLRRRCERWARRVIADIRAGRLTVPSGSPVQKIADHRDVDGRELSLAVAGVELINLLRPTVAVDHFLVHAAVALHLQPGARDVVAAGGTAEIRAFAEEVRRFAPFFPFIGGRVREPFRWEGHDFAPGEWVVLDIYGTDRDPRSFDEAEVFRPGRFLGVEPDPFAFIPQGGGEHAVTHRCPGEWITVELIGRMARLLARDMAYTVPEQDLSIRRSRVPARPQSGFAMADVRLVG